MSEYYSLFSVVGIEIEYMLVDANTLNVRAASDTLLEALAGKVVNEFALGDIAISNELVMHVLELKNNGPKPPHSAIAQQFQQTILQLQPLLKQHNLLLLPTGAHPWMNPERETKRWPHGDNEIYNQYDTIFDCKGHGWSNLQSMHVNLPFRNEEEFLLLHNAIRLILPLIPAIAASTPYLDGKFTGMLDTRLKYYASNQQKIPSIAGSIIPEFIDSFDDYERRILAPMYADIAPYDPQKILQEPWLNSRGAMVKFDCQAIEIRIIDSQEYVLADIAIAKAIIAILQYWINQSSYFMEKPCEITTLKALYDQTLVTGLSSAVDSSELRAQWHIKKNVSNCRDVWSYLLEKVSTSLDQPSQLALEYILKHGNLAERLVLTCGHQPQHAHLRDVYRQLSENLLQQRYFEAHKKVMSHCV